MTSLARCARSLVINCLMKRQRSPSFSATVCLRLSVYGARAYVPRGLGCGWGLQSGGLTGILHIEGVHASSATEPRDQSVPAAASSWDRPDEQGSDGRTSTGGPFASGGIGGTKRQTHLSTKSGDMLLGPWEGYRYRRRQKY